MATDTTNERLSRSRTSHPDADVSAALGRFAAFQPEAADPDDEPTKQKRSIGRKLLIGAGAVLTPVVLAGAFKLAPYMNQGDGSYNKYSHGDQADMPFVYRSIEPGRGPQSVTAEVNPRTYQRGDVAGESDVEDYVGDEATVAGEVRAGRYKVPVLPGETLPSDVKFPQTEQQP